MAATKTKAKKEAPKEKKPLPALTAEQKAQVQRVEQAVQGLVSSIEATSLPGRHLWSLKKAINMSVMEVLRRRRGDPRVRRQARLEEKLAKIQAEIVALKTQQK